MFGCNSNVPDIISDTGFQDLEIYMAQTDMVFRNSNYQKGFRFSATGNFLSQRFKTIAIIKPEQVNISVSQGTLSFDKYHFKYESSSRWVYNGIKYHAVLINETDKVISFVLEDPTYTRGGARKRTQGARKKSQKGPNVK